ncbi:ATP-binding protein [Candidatus Moduliflexota bacterium]
MFRNIWSNVVLLSSLLVLLIVTAFFYIVIDLDRRSLSQIKEETSTHVTQVLRHTWEEKFIELTKLLSRRFAQPMHHLEVAEMYELASLAGEGAGILYIYIHDSEGRILVDTTTGSIMMGEMPAKPFARRAATTGSVMLNEGFDFIEVATPIIFGSDRIGAVRIGFSKESIVRDTAAVHREIGDRIDRSIADTIRNTCLLGVVALFTSLVAGSIFAHRLSSPLRSLAKGTERISAGDLTYRAEIQSSDEVGQLAEAFNKMTGDLQRATVSKDYVDNIIRTMMGSLIIASPEGIILSVNQATVDMLGYGEEKLINLHLNAIFIEETFLGGAKVIDRLKKDDRVHYLEGSLRARDGRRIPVLLSGSVMRDAGGRAQGIVCVALDITERKEAEEAIKGYVRQLEHSNHLMRLFTDILSHDLLNPANIVTHMAALLLQKDGDRNRDELAMILRNGEKLTQLIRDASSYARVESSDGLAGEDMDLFVLIASVIDRHRPQFTEKGMSVLFRPPGEAPIIANPMIDDVFANIISNAAKYAPADSTVTVGLSDEGPTWLVSVADEGEGVSDGYKEAIFERFERHDKRGVRGTGLGLAIAKRLVELHGGKIWVEDAPGGGAIFSVRLLKEGLPPTG